MKIEKGIPIPPEPRGHLWRELIETFQTMEIGDSFILRTRSRQTLNALIKEIGVAIEVRMEGGDLRVWLTQRY